MHHLAKKKKVIMNAHLAGIPFSKSDNPVRKFKEDEIQPWNYLDSKN